MRNSVLCIFIVASLLVGCERSIPVPTLPELTASTPRWMTTSEVAVFNAEISHPNLAQWEILDAVVTWKPASSVEWPDCSMEIDRSDTAGCLVAAAGSDGKLQASHDLQDPGRIQSGFDFKFRWTVTLRSPDFSDPLVLETPELDFEIISGEVLDLDFLKASYAGAGVSEHASPELCRRVGAEDAIGSPYAPDGAQPGVVFVADCRGPGDLPGLTGGAANPQVYQHFELKNDWQVVSTELQFDTTPTGNDFSNTLEAAQSQSDRDQAAHTFRLEVQPEPGSTSPFTRAHISVIEGRYLRVYMKIRIEGPAGTDPYGQACPSRLVPVTTTEDFGCADAGDVAASGSPILPLEAGKEYTGPRETYACATSSDCIDTQFCAVLPAGPICVRGIPMRP